MKYIMTAIFLLAFTFAAQCLGETETVDSKSPSESEKSMFPLKDYSGDFQTRSNLLGDWNGQRNELANKGITIETEMTQVFQGNARGGKSTSGAWGYSGSTDYWLKIDTQRMGLWPDGLITLHGETIFGDSPYGSIGAIMPSNFDAVVPLPNIPGLTTLSEFHLTQFFTKEFGVLVGKVDPAALADKNVFAANEKTQFLNTAFRVNPTLFLYAPYTLMTAAAFYTPNDNLHIAFFAADSNGGATRTGFDTTFNSPRGVTVGTEWEFKINPCGLVGHQRIGYGYSNKTYQKLEIDPRTNFPPGSTLPETQEGDTGIIWYNFDQYLHAEADDPTQGVGVFGRFGYSDGTINSIQRFYSFGVGGKGICQGRDDDTFGVGYYYVDLSDDLPAMLNLSSEQGVELFYNIEITKSIHFTPDFQWIIDPGAGSGGLDNTVVLGGRLQMSF